MASIALPRDIADAVIVHGFATAQRSIVLIGAVFTMVAVSMAVTLRGGDLRPLVLSFLALLTIAALCLQLLVRPTVTRAAMYLVVGFVASVVYLVALLRADERMDEPGPYFVNWASAALIMVGAARPHPRSGVIWTVAGFLAAVLSLVAGSLIAGRPFDLGLTPMLAVILSLFVYVALGTSRRNAQGRVPDLQALQGELELSERQLDLERRGARMIHDTVLADLAIVSMRPGVLDEGARSRIERDLAIASAGTVGIDTSEPPSHRSPIANDFLELARDYQWSGVNVGVSGSESLDVVLDPEVRDAVIGAVRAALDNVIRHAGTDRAEVMVGARNDTLSVLVVDDGVGFPSTILAADRLGVSSSIHARVRSVGGTVRVWSGDEGTTVMLSVPTRAGGDES
jgi:signal transduction histidine kinase